MIINQKRYNMNSKGIGDDIDRKKYTWLLDNLKSEDYSVYRAGFLIDEYYVQFHDEKAETLFILAFGGELV